MKPLASHYSSCDPELSYIFNPYFGKLSHEFADEYYSDPKYMYAPSLRIGSLEFEGQYPIRALTQAKIEPKVMTIPIEESKASYFLESHCEIIKLWEQLSKYKKIMTFHGLDNLFLKLTENREKVSLPSQKMQWLLQVEEEYNVFKARKLLEGF